MFDNIIIMYNIQLRSTFRTVLFNYYARINEVITGPGEFFR